MGLSSIEVKQIKKDFEKEYFLSAPYNAYVNSCGISNLEVMQRIKQESIDLKHGESLEDLCLSVSLRKTPPADMQFPEVYQGMRVFYKFEGVVRAL